MKKIVALALAALLVLSLSALAETRVAALNGPTGMGMVGLMKEEEASDRYTFTLAGSADLIVPKLVRGELDIACVPANLASVLFNNTEGKVRVLAVNTLGVLYIVERGNGVQELSDLKGRTVYAAGQGSTPEYVLNYLLRCAGLKSGKDVKIVWKSEHAECLAALLQDDTGCALLPQPFVTVAQSRKDDIRIAIDLNREWENAEKGNALITGVVVARTAFTQEHPEETKEFLERYAASVESVNADPETAAALIGAYGIVDEQVALRALPYCNIVCITGDEMKTMLSGYLAILYEQDAGAVGGKVPDEAFYYVP